MGPLSSQSSPPTARALRSTLMPPARTGARGDQVRSLVIVVEQLGDRVGQRVGGRLDEQRRLGITQLAPALATVESHDGRPAASDAASVPSRVGPMRSQTAELQLTALRELLRGEQAGERRRSHDPAPRAPASHRPHGASGRARQQQLDLEPRS